MKKLYIILLTMVMTMMFVISPLYATETVEAATATYTTEKDSEKIYFPLNSRWTSTLKLPLNYKSGKLYTKNYYDLNAPIASVGYGEIYKLSYNTKTITAKIVKNKATGKTHVVVAPKAKGTTTLKITISKDGFNKVVINTKISVTSKELDATTCTIKDIYRVEYTNVKNGVLPQYSKLFLFELNKERQLIKLSDLYKTVYELTIAQETIKLLTKSSKINEVEPILTIDEKVNKLVDKRRIELQKLGKLDDHEGFEKLISTTSEFDDYVLSETLVSYSKFAYPASLISSYKKSELHWAKLAYAKVNIVGVSCFKVGNSIFNVTVPGSYLEESIADKIFELDSKYEYLMTPEEREYYGVDDSYDGYEDPDDFDGSSDDYDWSI